MTARNKRRLLVLLGFASMMMIIIAAGLTRLDFQPGLPLPSLSNNGGIIIPSQEHQPMVTTISEVVKIVVGILFGCFQIYIIYKLLKGVSWREILAPLLDSIIILLLVGTVLFLIISFMPPGEDTSASQEITIAQPAPVAESPLGPVPPGLIWAAGIILTIISILVGFWIFSSIIHKDRTIDLVQIEAEKAYKAILSGQDLKNVILKCYYQMGVALKRGRGIERQQYMTTGEFEQLLKDEGIPFEPIHQLTRLFEVVRYGHEKPSRQEEQSAIDCLTSIVHYCEEIQQAT